MKITEKQLRKLVREQVKLVKEEMADDDFATWAVRDDNMGVLQDIVDELMQMSRSMVRMKSKLRNVVGKGEDLDKLQAAENAVGDAFVKLSKTLEGM